MKKSSTLQPRNRMLLSLPPAELKAISPELKTIPLSRDTVLFEGDEPGEYLYFPDDAVVSFLGDTGQGGRIEIWAVGNEGVAGISELVGGRCPYRGVVQVSGNALMAQTNALRRHFQLWGGFHRRILTYLESLVVHIAQLGICNASHPVDQRFCRWLLMIQDRAGSHTLSFTQESIAGVLGTRRATISVAAAALQNAGLIRYTPGSITIRSRAGLQARACACYKLLKDWA